MTNGPLTPHEMREIMSNQYKLDRAQAINDMCARANFMLKDLISRGEPLEVSYKRLALAGVLPSSESYPGDYVKEVLDGFRKAKWEVSVGRSDCKWSWPWILGNKMVKFKEL